MSILVIFTGGTIGSSISDGYISPDEANKSKLINMYLDRENTNQHFEVDTPYTVLSENLGGEHITKLVRCIVGHISDNKYDGIIVTHGTDTLQYMAAALGIVFENVDIPVMLVSSNFPLDDARANGYENFKAAVEYIQNNGAPGVYATYKNTGEELQIFPACSMLKYDIYSDKIRKSGEVESDTIKNAEEKFLSEKVSIFANMNIAPERFNLSETSPIKFIMPYPGIQYDIPGEDIKAILFGSYHSGTIQTSRKELIEFCSEMKSRGVPMYICGVPEGIGYESTKYYEELGISVLPYGTDIYWYMKLWIVYGAIK